MACFVWAAVVPSEAPGKRRKRKRARAAAASHERKPNEAAAELDALGKAAYKARIWDDAVRYLAIAAVNLQRLLDVDRIVLAGGLTNAADDLMVPLREHYAQLEWRITPQPCPIVIATLGPDAGVLGAAGVAAHTFAH